MFDWTDYFMGDPGFSGSALSGLATMWSFVTSLLSWDIVAGSIALLLALYLVGLMLSRFSRALR